MSSTYPLVYSVNMASGATFSSAIALERSFSYLYLEIPTMASGSLYIQASSDNSTFRRVKADQVTTATALAHLDYLINSTVTNTFIRIPQGFRYYRIESSSGATDVTTTFKFIGAD